MPVFQCNDCPSGPCTLVNMDPEFEAGSKCPDIRSHQSTVAVWRELVVQ